MRCGRHGSRSQRAEEADGGLPERSSRRVPSPYRWARFPDSRAAAAGFWFMKTGQRCRKEQISCVDLFCGIGGLTHGLIRGGVKVAAGIDLDPQCRFAYEENNEAHFIESDVSNLSGADIRALWAKGHYRLLAGCAPCQPFSTYSRKGRKTRKDLKWSLVAEFGRLVRESQPDLVTMENVPQLVQH